jgi:hypothetical protein
MTTIKNKIIYFLIKHTKRIYCDTFYAVCETMQKWELESLTKDFIKNS